MGQYKSPIKPMFRDEFGRINFHGEHGNRKFILRIRDYHGGLGSTFYIKNARYGFETMEKVKSTMFRYIPDYYEYKYDDNGRQIYCKNKLNGHYYKSKYDKHGNRVTFEFSAPWLLNWSLKYGDNNQLIKYEDSDGNWWDIEHFPNTECPFEIDWSNYW